MSTDVGFIFSLCAGVLIGLRIFYRLLDEWREARQEENELVNQQLKRQMERICWEQRYKSEFEKLNKECDRLKQEISDQQVFEAALRAAEKKKWDAEHKIPMTDFADCTNNFTTWEPKDGMLLEYHGKLIAYHRDKGWTVLEVDPKKLSRDEIIKDLWYGTGGK